MLAAVRPCGINGRYRKARPSESSTCGQQRMRQNKPFKQLMFIWMPVVLVYCHQNNPLVCLQSAEIPFKPVQTVQKRFSLTVTASNYSSNPPPGYFHGSHDIWYLIQHLTMFLHKNTSDLMVKSRLWQHVHFSGRVKQLPTPITGPYGKPHLVTVVISKSRKVQILFVNTNSAGA